jgi:hypothetical protein
VDFVIILQLTIERATTILPWREAQKSTRFLPQWALADSQVGETSLMQLVLSIPACAGQWPNAGLRRDNATLAAAFAG